MKPHANRPSPSAQHKIQKLSDLAAVLGNLRNQGRKIVHCHGVFDLIHIGHVRHLEEARRYGDVLVVTLTPDQWVNKGPHRPAFPEDLRAEMLAALNCVDYVAINGWPTAVETIKLLKPHYFAKGSEYREANKDVTGFISEEEQAVQSIGSQLVFTEDIIFSSSNLINRHMTQLTKEGTEFLREFSTRSSVEEIYRPIEQAKNLKVLVVGETIIDEYHYCQTLGKAGKEPILAMRFDSSESFGGGNLAVANHVASFTDNVRLLSYLGAEHSQEDFCRSKVSPKVSAEFFFMPNAPTIVKRRFIERYPFQKMFEVYFMKEYNSESPEAARFRQELRDILPQFDLTIVTDYGHGMLDAQAVALLCEGSRCLAVNTQSNAGNHGFNTISKYPRADFVCLSEYEIRLEARSRREELRQIVHNVAEKLNCRKVMVTQGNQGLLCYTRGEGFVRVPAFTTHFTDRIGAGDAVFSLASLLMVQDVPGELMALVGNAVGAMAVEIIGNRTAIDRVGLQKFLVSLIK
jgi:rfaE bifunctional protein nucleotidyltransferase chain/domain